MAITPVWKSLAWPITLDSAREFVEYLFEQQKDPLSASQSLVAGDDKTLFELNLAPIKASIDGEIAAFQARPRTR